MTSDVGNGLKANEWTFRSDTVASAFDNHVAMSTPGYDELQRLIGRLSTFFVRNGSVVVDYGCATGRTIAEIAAANKDTKVRYIAVDESEQMTLRATERFQGRVEGAEVRTSAILACPPPIESDLLLAVYTLMFLGFDDRKGALRMMRRAVNAALVVVEKTVADDPSLVIPFYDTHHDEKLERFSAAEVFGKARSIRSVMRPMTMKTNENMFIEAGWRPQRFWQHLAFTGWILQ